MISSNPTRAGIAEVLGSIFVIGLAAGLLPSASAQTAAPTAPAAETRPAETTLPSRPQTKEEWRAKITHTRVPKKGCFKSSFPSGEWQEIPCATPPARPYPPARGNRPDAVGNGNDFSAQTSKLISTATGTFDSVKGVTGESDSGSNTFSLQLNTNTFSNTPACKGAATSSCQGWQQFVYSNSGTVFMQYWLIGYGNNCPSGWNGYQNVDCWKNSDGAGHVSSQSIADLAELSVSGNADPSGVDTVFVTTASGDASATSQDSVLDLAKGWKAAEFNIFGDCCSTQANFNCTATLVVRTSIEDGGTAAPSCVEQGFTGETNNLNLVKPCQANGGSLPSIVFTENAAGGVCTPAATGSALTSFALNDNSTRFYFLDKAGWVHEVGWTGSGWEQTLMQSHQAGTPAASGSALTSFALNGNSTRVYYLDKEGWIHELGWTGSGWEHTSLAATQGVYRAASGSALTSFALNNGYTRLYYLDVQNWAHELGWTGSGWERTDLQGSQGGIPAAAGSPLTSFALNGDSTRLYYFDKDGWVNEVGWTGHGWEHTNLSGTQGSYRAASGSAMTSFALNSGYTRIYYLDGQNWVHELGWTGSGWERSDLQANQGGVPATAHSALTSFALNGDSTRLYYLDNNGWVHELGWTGSGWEHTNLSAAQGLFQSVSGSALSSFGLYSSGYTRAYYFDTKTGISELGWTGSGWEHSSPYAASIPNGP
jgi:hypothetical protein